jgi:hypothetical protein
MMMGQTECSEKSAYKIRMPGNHPNERIHFFKFSVLKFGGFSLFSYIAVTRFHRNTAYKYRDKAQFPTHGKDSGNQNPPDENTGNSRSREQVISNDRNFQNGYNNQVT